jgi:hypothetical protein
MIPNWKKISPNSGNDQMVLFISKLEMAISRVVFQPNNEIEMSIHCILNYEHRAL